MEVSGGGGDGARRENWSKISEFVLCNLLLLAPTTNNSEYWSFISHSSSFRHFFLHSLTPISLALYSVLSVCLCTHIYDFSVCLPNAKYSSCCINMFVFVLYASMCVCVVFGDTNMSTDWYSSESTECVIFRKSEHCIVPK